VRWVSRRFGTGWRFPDRFQNQLRRGLRHPVPYCRDTQRTLPAARLGDHFPPHRLWFVRLIVQVPPEAVQPLLQPCRLDVLEALSVYPRRATVGFCQGVGMLQDVFPVHLVVELIEAISRLILRLPIQLVLQIPNLFRCCQAHRQSPLLLSFSSSPQARALPSTGVTRLPVPLTLSDALMVRGPFLPRCRPRPCLHPGPPLLTHDYLLGMLCSLPRWSDPCCWLLWRRAPASGSSGSIPPSPLQRRVGTTLGLSGPAQASLALRPAKSLAHHSWTLSRGSSPASFPTEPLASYRI